MDSSTSRALAPDEQERALAAARSLGYELQVLDASAVLTGRRLEVSVTLTNRGVAPFYASWPVHLVAADSKGGETMTEMPFSLKSLLPGMTRKSSVSLDLTRLEPGEITLLLGVMNPMKGGRPLRFANADQDRDRNGWLTLGKIVVP